MNDVLKQVGATVGWSAIGLAILYVGTLVFDLLDPIDYRKEIQAGNTAAAVKLGAITLSLAAIIVVVIAF